LNYLILSNPILGLFPESYSYPVYMQYAMIWHANASRPQKYWSIYRMHMIVQIWVPNQIWSENTAVQIYFKNNFIFGLGSYLWRKEIKSQETVPENNLIKSVASNCLVSGDAHDLVNRLILMVLVGRLVTIRFENLWSQNRLNRRVSYSRLVWIDQGIPDSESWLLLFSVRVLRLYLFRLM
jgi:hypothetical protein